MRVGGIENRGGEMFIEFPAQLAFEAWRDSGERTEARLNGLVEHYARIYGRSAEYDDLKAQAMSAIPLWMRPTDWN
jgi:hypothetical protein